jgi:TRAP-type C4-dicarboxylate transport system permease small subunit
VAEQPARPPNAARPRDPLAAAARPFAWVALLGLAFMVLITTVAVLARWLFREEVFGVVDMMELALGVCVFVALPGLFLRDENVTVDLIDSLGSRPLTFALRLFALALAFAFLALTASQMIAPALEKLRSGEGTMTLQIPRYWHWLPVLIGFFGSTLAVIAVAVRVIRRGAHAPPDRTRSSLD